MKVIHYISSIDRTSGGTSSYIQLLAKELGKLVDLHIVTHRSDHPLEMENCTVHYISSWRHFIGMKCDFILLLDEICPDVVHVNCCWIPGCALTQRWAQEKGYRVVLTPHGMLEPWIMKRHYLTRKLPALLLYQKRAIVQADMLHATAYSERDNLLRLGYNDRIMVIANGVDVGNITMKQSWKRRKEILFLSRVHVKKGINFLIEAVAELKPQLDGYTIRIAGEGNEAYINELKQQTVRMGVEDIVRFEGGVYGDEKWRLYQQADLFVLPTHSENFGIVVAEALASGTPVVTTKGTPWSDLNTDHCGWWTGIGPQPIVNALCEFLQLTESDLEVMGRNGRRVIEERYSARSMAQQMVCGLY